MEKNISNQIAQAFTNAAKKKVENHLNNGRTTYGIKDGNYIIIYKNNNGKIIEEIIGKVFDMKKIILKYKLSQIQKRWYEYIPDHSFVSFHDNEKTYIKDYLHPYMYYNKNYLIHRDDGYAAIYLNDNDGVFYINGISVNFIEFADETNHLICNYCREFCKQKCF